MTEPNCTKRRTPLVTVLTPTFNRREMLRLTLASVQMQTYSNVEHIVLDGGSTDGTVDLLQRAGRNWNVSWVSEPDGGMYEALNKGLHMANGEFVGWVNSDDWLLPWTCAQVAAHMLRSPAPHAVYGDVLSTSPRRQEANIQVYGQFNRKALATVATLPQPTVFWPKSALADVGFLDLQTYRQIADCDYWLRLSRIMPFIKIRDFLAVVVNHADTKRESLTEEVAQEFDLLRRNYRPRGSNTIWERSKDALRWRAELTALLGEKGWSSIRSQSDDEIGFCNKREFRRLSAFGPKAKHPLTHLKVGIGPYIEALTTKASELDTLAP